MFNTHLLRYRLPLIVLTWITCPPSSAVAADEVRSEWQYIVPAGLRRIVHEGADRWRLHFPNGTSHAMTERTRSADYIEIQNDTNGNVLRLYADHGEIRAAAREEFRMFTRGKWLASGKSDPLASVNPAVTPMRRDSAIENSATENVAGSLPVVDMVYFMPQDRQPANEYEDKLRLIGRLMEAVITKDLRSKGYEIAGPRFRRHDGEIVIAIDTGGNFAYSQWLSP